jgi:hypothetical protein
MKTIFAVAAILTLTALSAAAAETGAERGIALKGDATVYGGDISDPIAPVAGGDAKVFFNLTGKAAQRMYELMGRAAEKHGACEEPGVTQRERGVVSCMHDKDGYACYLAYDLKTGKAISQSSC